MVSSLVINGWELIPPVEAATSVAIEPEHEHESVVEFAKLADAQLNAAFRCADLVIINHPATGRLFIGSLEEAVAHARYGSALREGHHASPRSLDKFDAGIGCLPDCKNPI
jgi:hypothetical protein